MTFAHCTVANIYANNSVMKIYQPHNKVAVEIVANEFIAPCDIIPIYTRYSVLNFSQKIKLKLYLFVDIFEVDQTWLPQGSLR